MSDVREIIMNELVINSSTAMFSAYVSLLKVLHKNKVIDINDVVVEMGNTIDFAKAQHMDEKTDQSCHLVIYQNLLLIADALTLADENLKKY